MKLMQLVVAAALLACTSTKMVMREGCWVRQTTRTFGGTDEQLGVCMRHPAAPAEDRLARLLQECMDQAEHRWENQAISSWTSGQPAPKQADDGELVKTCMAQATAALGLMAENEQLKMRLADVAKDRESLKQATEHDRAFLEQTSDKMTTALGEAAQKPLPNATATATVKAETSESRTPPTVVTAAAPAPVIVTTPAAAPAPVPVIVTTPAAAPAPAPARARCAIAKTAAVAPSCQGTGAPLAQEPRAAGVLPEH